MVRVPEYHWLCDLRLRFAGSRLQTSPTYPDRLMNCSFNLLLTLPLLTLQACSPAPNATETAAAAAEQTAPQAAPAVEASHTLPAAAFADFDTTISVRDLMKTLIDPNARELWGGVSYVQTEQGVDETVPQTQEDWDALRRNAIALIEGSNALMLPGRKIDPAPDTVTPDFQFTPQEIEQMLAEDPETWIINLQTMQDSVLQTLEMIDRKDILGFTERGATINEACETCHAQYWYKPLPMAR